MKVKQYCEHCALAKVNALKYLFPIRITTIIKKKLSAIRFFLYTKGRSSLEVSIPRVVSHGNNSLMRQTVFHQFWLEGQAGPSTLFRSLKMVNRTREQRPMGAAPLPQFTQ